MTTLRRRLAPAPAGLACMIAGSAALVAFMSAGCDRNQGQVEVNWSVVDRAGTTVFPSGVLGSTCGFAGLLAAGDAEPTPYALSLQLRLCEPGCAGGCEDPACQIDLLRFDCESARGFGTVEARSAAPYDFHVDLVAVPDDGACGCTLTPPCALVPGPRSRTVEPGLVTDLQVYLLVLGLDNIRAARQDGRTRLDLATCCSPDPTCAAP